MAYFCYVNPNPVFKPATKLLASITRANPALVTTTTAHEYNTGLIVRLIIPTACGMPQLNGQTFQITVVSSTEFTIDIDTIEFDPFDVPTGLTDFIDICAWVVPIGEGTDYTDSIPTNVTGG
jgi:hypothetical protein